VPPVPSGWDYTDPDAISGTPGQLYFGYDFTEGSTTEYMFLLYMWFELPGESGGWKRVQLQNI
jgi:hypothetical protein